MSRVWRVGTRGSSLARVQTDFVIDRLRQVWPDDKFEPRVIRTAGDRDQLRPLSAFGTFGVFVKEIERALLAGEVDLAVHSAKDLTTQLDVGLTVAAFPVRGPVYDVLITSQRWDQDSDGLPLLPENARVATSSVRRQGQLRQWRPDLRLENLRGSVETRLRKLFDHDLDAVVLAAAGLERLGLLKAGSDAGEPVPVGKAYAYPLDPERFVPAAGQGALAVQVGTANGDVRRLAASVDDPDTRLTQRAERAFMLAMGASCEIPIGALARRDGQSLRIVGYYSDAKIPRQEIIGPIHEAEALGLKLAELMQPPGGLRPGNR